MNQYIGGGKHQQSQSTLCYIELMNFNVTNLMFDNQFVQSIKCTMQ